MKNYFLTDISILQMQIFITAAEELNFTRTANCLHVTQPTVSRTIDALESSLGLVLFYKTRNRIQLTPAGRQLQDSFRRALSLIDSGIQKSALLQEGYRDSLLVNIPAEYSPYTIHRLCKNFRDTNPSVNYQFQVSFDIPGSLLMLDNYECDIVLTHLFFQPYVQQYEDLVCEVVSNQPFQVYMKKENPLSDKESLTVKDLKKCHLLFPRMRDSFYVRTFISNFEKVGGLPAISRYLYSPLDGFANLMNEKEILIADSLANPPEDCVMIPLKDVSSGTLAVCKSANANNPTVRNFIESFKDSALHLLK